MSLYIEIEEYEVLKVGQDVSIAFIKSKDKKKLCKVSIKAPKNLKIKKWLLTENRPK